MQRNRLRAARELWAVRQLSGFGIQLPARLFLRILAGIWVLCVPVLIAIGDAGIGLASIVIAGQDGTAAQQRTATSLAALTMLGIAYLAVVDVLRATLTNVRFAVSRSPMRRLWDAVDISLPEAVMIERGMPILFRATMLSAVGCGVAAQLTRSGATGATQAWSLAWLVPTTYAVTAGAAALWHAGQTRLKRPPRGAWFAVLVLASASGWTLASLAHTTSGGLSLAIPGHLVMGWMSVLVTFLLIAAIGAATIVVARDPRRVIPRDDQASQENSPEISLTARLSRGLGVAQRMGLVTRILGATGAVASALIGWRLGGGALLPAADHLPRAAAVIGVFGASTIAAAAVAVGGQGSNLWRYRYLWEQGVSSRLLYFTTLRIGGVQSVVFALLLGLIGLMGWGQLPIRAMLVVVAVCWGEQLVDSLFTRAQTSSDGERSADPAAAIGSLALALIALVFAVSPGGLSVAALVLFTFTIGVSSSWLFSKRLQHLPVVAA